MGEFRPLVVKRWGKNTYQAQVVRGEKFYEPVVVCDHSHRTQEGARRCTDEQMRDVTGSKST